MKTAGFVLLLTVFVLLAVGAYSKGQWMAYSALVSVCVALIVKKERYLNLSPSARTKPIVVVLLFFIAVLLLYAEHK